MKKAKMKTTSPEYRKLVDECKDRIQFNLNIMRKQNEQNITNTN